MHVTTAQHCRNLIEDVLLKALTMLLACEGKKCAALIAERKSDNDGVDLVPFCRRTTSKTCNLLYLKRCMLFMLSLHRLLVVVL